MVFKNPTWYRANSFRALKASIDTPIHFLVELEDDKIRKLSLPSHITNIFWINHERLRLHWTVTHLSLSRGIFVYHDSMLEGSGVDFERAAEWCNATLSRCSIGGRQSQYPSLECKATVIQNDSHSSGPLAFREVERILGLNVSQDGGDPIAIRARHAKLVFRVILRDLQKPTDLYTSGPLIKCGDPPVTSQSPLAGEGLTRGAEFNTSELPLFAPRDQQRISSLDFWFMVLWSTL